MLQCKTFVHDRSHLEFSSKEENGYRTGKAHDLFVALDGSDLKFYTDPKDKKEVFSLNPARMNADNDKNSHSLTLTIGGDDNPILEIRADVETLHQIEQYVTKRAKVHYKGCLFYTPANRTRETIFTSGQLNTNLRGFLNLALLALIFAKFRDIIKNFLAYGMVLTASLELTVSAGEFISYVLSMLIPIFITLWVEKKGLQNKVSSGMVDIIETVNTLGLIVVPIIMCNIFKPAPFPGIIYTGFAITLIMKLYSFSHVMNDLRKTIPRILKLEKENKDIIGTLGEHELSRENLEIILKHRKDLGGLANVRDLSYFLIVPTFCYQLWYPRNRKIRWNYLAKRVCEAGLCWALFAFVLNQYIMPIMDESVQILEKGTFLEFLERLIRLSFPCQVCWILFFFGTFQYAFNICAELTRFADRQFYKDWWNCRDLNEYWRLWNLPIHEFFHRHVYYPMLKKGYRKDVAKLWVFLLSALGHEYWASVPLRVFALWAFFLMLIQAPVMIVELKLDKFFKGSQIGNIFFWISFCFIGQPMALLLYYQLYLKKHGHAV